MKLFLIVSLFVLSAFGCDKKDIERSAPVKYTTALQNSVDAAKQKAQKANISVIKSALELYNSQKGEYPASLEELVSEGYLSGLPKGEWGYDGNGHLKEPQE